MLLPRGLWTSPAEALACFSSNCSLHLTHPTSDALLGFRDRPYECNHLLFLCFEAALVNVQTMKFSFTYRTSGGDTILVNNVPIVSTYDFT